MLKRFQKANEFPTSIEIFWHFWNTNWKPTGRKFRMRVLIYNRGGTSCFRWMNTIYWTECSSFIRSNYWPKFICWPKSMLLNERPMFLCSIFHARCRLLCPKYEHVLINLRLEFGRIIGKFHNISISIGNSISIVDRLALTLTSQSVPMSICANDSEHINDCGSGHLNIRGVSNSLNLYTQLMANSKSIMVWLICKISMRNA